VKQIFFEYTVKPNIYTLVCVSIKQSEHNEGFRKPAVLSK